MSGPGEGFSSQENDNESFIKSEQLRELHELGERLGFEESSLMKELKDQIIKGPENIEPLFKKWRYEGGRIVNGMKGKGAFGSGQIALLASEAGIYLELDLVEKFSGTIASAIEYCAHTGREEISSKLLEIGSM